MAYAQLIDGVWTEIHGEFSAGSGDERANYPADVVQKWSAEDLAPLGVLPIAETPQPTDPALRVTGQQIDDVDGVPTRTWITGPRPVPDEVPMYKVEKILVKQGLLPTVEAALAAMEGEAGDLARVDWKRAPNLVRLSPLVQGLGAAIGLTAEEIDELVLAADALP